MAKWNKGLVAAMEELEEMENEGAEVEGGADSLETSMIETNEAGADLDDMDSSIEEAVEGAEEIEAIADTLDETVEEGGADPATARVAEVAVESIYRRLGLTRRALPSMESFGTRSGRVQATKVAVEGLKEQAQAIWEKIKKAVASAWEWIKNFFTKMFDATAKLKDRAQKMVKATAKVSGKPKKEKISAGGWAGVLTLDGNFTPANAEGSCALMSEKLTEASRGVFELSKSLKGVTPADLEELPDTPQVDPLKGMEKHTDLPGGKKIEFKEGKYFTKSGFMIVDAKKANKELTEVATADAAMLKKISQSVLDIADNLINLNKMQKETEGALATINKMGEQVVKNASKENDKSMGIKVTMSMTTEAVSMLISLTKTFSTLSLTVGKAGLDYVEKSLAEYTVAKD